MIHGRSGQGRSASGVFTLQLQSLRLSGFKTFASPTLIEFADGITAIVGSNGSGKSNIVDALKWVLGEQSLRDLRSRRAEDVIFSGSQARRPGSMAEVSLVFGNESRWLPVEATEVELIRRLYRSAEGEYVLNQQRVRLRDILDLVRLGGLDAGGHTIVSQGLVDSVLSLRGTERRAFIATVAGIAPYESKRNEAFSRLAQTKQNMASAQIVYEEIEPRLRLLKRQANLAESAQAARLELQRALESHYAREWQTLSQRETAARQAYDTATVAVGRLRTLVDEMESRRRAHQVEVDGVRAERQLRRDRFVAAEYGLKRAQDARAAAAIALTRVNSDLIQLEDQLASFGRGRDVDAAVAGADARIEQLDARRTDLREQARRLQEEIELLDLKRRAIGERKQAAASELANLQRSHRSKLARREQLSEELDRIQQIRAEAKVELPRLSVAVGDQQNKLDEDKEEIRRLADAQQRTVAGRETALASSRQAGALLEECRTSAHSIESRIGHLTSQQDELSRTTPTPAGQATVLQVLRIPEEYALAVAAVLGPVAESPADPHPAEPGPRRALLPDANWRREVLQAVAAKASGAEWLDVALGIEDGLGAPAALLQSTIIMPSAADLEGAWEAVQALVAGPIGQAALHLVSLDGSYRIAGQRGSATMRSRETVQREVTIQRLAVEIDQLKRQRQDIDELITLREAESREALQAVETATLANEAGASALALARANLAASEATASRLQQDLDRRRASFDQLEVRTEQIQQELILSASETKEYDQRVAEIEAALVQADTELVADSEAMATNETKLRDLRSDVSLVDRELEMERREHNRLTVLKEAAARERADLTRRIGETLDGRRRVEAEVVETTQAVTGAEEELESARISLAEAPPEPTLEEGVASFAELQKVHSEIEELVGEQQRQQSELDHLTTSLGLLIENCQIDLDRLPSSLPTANDERQVSELELRRLRVRAEQAADIEPNAAEEYRQLADRRQLLEEQLTDLAEASETLETMLADTDREVRRRFRIAFSRVSDLFSMYFKDIFGGGVGELILESREEVESVEITAQLPGKRARDLSGLSGGERTLVAGAFLFSLLAASPPPFCVLDEVDAALDETNVDRYLGVLRELAGQTQFVVVTHNRGTMAAADTLYGIVLDPNAGSRALSLRLDQAVAG